MARRTHPSVNAELRKTKAALLAVSSAFAGVLLITFAGWFDGLELGPWNWLHVIPFGEFGGILFGAGVIGAYFEYGMRKEQAAVVVEQVDKGIDRSIPKIRDAVVEAFAIHPEDLRRVATPELLDDLAANAMSLRLGDEQFAREIYADIRDQAVKAAERWHDVEVRIRLSKALERSAGGTPLFDVTVEWEYTTVPSGTVRRFACTSDRAEYNELLLDVPATSPWLMTNRPGMDASSKESYELLELTVDGIPQVIRRTVRKNGQTYSVALADTARSGQPVRIRQVFRTITPQWGHRLFFELPQPGRNMSLTMDYTDTDIVDMRVSDTVGSARAPQVTRTPRGVAGKTITVESRGWLMPHSGFAFTWALRAELPRDDREAA
ncbi:hypothetical protein FK529_18920 [Tsukamurella asaccharolytica]|uniref:Uncharacterized protein n=1 Tax=Tsukamurella asaccharolytica TaxID=2592067 RepID=A0A5C5R3A4_9ACTN|nr:hypothetical protein FK529_18920 [Tsukamurella asaccharolytica]